MFAFVDYHACFAENSSRDESVESVPAHRLGAGRYAQKLLNRVAETNGLPGQSGSDIDQKLLDIVAATNGLPMKAGTSGDANPASGYSAQNSYDYNNQYNSYNYDYGNYGYGGGYPGYGGNQGYPQQQQQLSGGYGQVNYNVTSPPPPPPGDHVQRTASDGMLKISWQHL